MARPILVICVDGLDPAYLDRAHTPALDEVKRRGLFRLVQAVVPTVTNVNTVSLLTGRYPEEHGIVANYWRDRRTGREQYMETGEFLLAPTLFQRVREAGGRTALLTAKEKLRALLSPGAHTAFSAEKPSPWAVEATGPPPDIYSLEVNFWLLEAARHLLRSDPPDLLYLLTTDYPYHTYPPEHPKAVEHTEGLDRGVGRLLEEHPDLELYLTADHGMGEKTQGLDIEKVLAEKGVRAQVVPIIKDRYVVHHQNLGGAAYVYLEDPAQEGRALEVLRSLEHIEEALPRAEASRRYHLHPERIGDIFLLADRETVVGALAAPQEAVRVRSHGSRYEERVPLLAWNTPASFSPRENRDIGAFLFSRFG